MPTPTTKILIKPKQSKYLHRICLAINISLALNMLSLFYMPIISLIFLVGAMIPWPGADPKSSVFFWIIGIYSFISSIVCIILATKDTNLSKYGYNPQHLRSVINLNLYLAIFSPLALIPNVIFTIFALTNWLPSYEFEYANASLANDIAQSTSNTTNPSTFPSPTASSHTSDSPPSAQPPVNP